LTAVVCRTPSLPKAAGSAPVNAAGGAAGGDGRLGEREAEDILVIDSQLSYESRCQYLRAVSSSGPSSRWRSRQLIRTSLWCQSSGPSLRWRASPRREIIVRIMVLVLACGVKVRVRDPPPRFGGLPLAKGGRNILILIPQYVPHMLVHFYVE
jgi:hypothetical protein